MDQAKIGEFLKELRNEKKMTQEQLAQHFNVSSRTVSRWETGRNLPDVSLLVEIADFYDVDVRELIEGERKSEMMDKDVKETAGEMAVYASTEKKELLSFIQLISLLGLFVTAAALVLQLVTYESDLWRFGAAGATFVGLVIMAVISLYVTGLLSRIVENKAFMKAIKVVAFVVAAIPTCYFMFFAGVTMLAFLSAVIARVEVHKDVSEYNQYIHNSTDNKYRTCDGERFEVFPERITDGMEVKEFQYTYYNPWDEQHVAYMTVAYSDEAYEAEKKRLQNIGQDEYVGFYSVEGEPLGYDLLAMRSDDYYGFVYAMIPEDAVGNSTEITYVGIDFCNYFLDLNIHRYLPDKYLLEGFNASSRNPYKRMKEKEMDQK